MQTTAGTDTFVGSTEAAAILGIDKSTLTRWVAAGEVEAAGRVSNRKNSAFVFTRAEIERVKREKAAA